MPFSCGNRGRPGKRAMSESARQREIIGFLKNDPAVPSFVMSGNFVARIERIALAISLGVESCVPAACARTRSVYEIFGDDCFERRSATRTMIYSRCFLKKLVRYANAASARWIREDSFVALLTTSA